MYSTPYESPAEFQWDPDSKPCQSTNCGPTTATKIAVFYRDKPQFDINDTRRLAVSGCGATNVTQQAEMLRKRGVPCVSDRRDLYGNRGVRDLVKSARRPVGAALDMSKVPASIRLHPFTGRHEVTVLGLARGRCKVHDKIEDGVWIADPNFHRDRNVAPKRIFYPNHVFKTAHDSLGNWTIVPNDVKRVAPKPPPPEQTVTTDTRVPYVRNIETTAVHGLNVREHPRSGAKYLGTLKDGTHKTTRMLERAGGSYKMGDKTMNDWVQVIHNGKVGWIARGWTKNI